MFDLERSDQNCAAVHYFHSQGSLTSRLKRMQKKGFNYRRRSSVMQVFLSLSLDCSFCRYFVIKTLSLLLGGREDLSVGEGWGYERVVITFLTKATWIFKNMHLSTHNKDATCIL